MYNGTGLQTARGSGTSGYVQSNKFFAKPNATKAGADSSSRVTPDIPKKPSKDISEHDRRRQVELKLAVLEDKLADQGYTDEEIAEKLQEARVTIEGASSEDDSNVASGSWRRA